MNDKTQKSHYDYVIVGAGPAGLQLAYYLERAGRDYVVLDAGARAGNFFERYPRHGTLLSINKVHTGRTEREFNMRHDWNSLVTEPGDDHFFKDYSREYFPKAEALVRYLGDFAEKFALRIRYNTQVATVERPEPRGNFELALADGGTVSCARLVMATGLSKPFIPDIPGIEHCVGYEDMSVDPEDYTGKNVLILGKGNSALETANHLMAHAAIIHLSSPESIRFAWDTHFVGHLRSTNSVFLDSYLLKSQNGVLDGETCDIRKGDNGKLIVRWRSKHTDVDEEIEQMEYDVVLRCTGFRFEPSVFGESCQPEMRSCGRLPQLTGGWESTTVPDLFFAGTIMQTLDYKRSQSSFIHGFRHNVQTLASMLEARYEGQGLPSEPIELGAENLARAVLQRANTTCALWQQVGFLCDLIELPQGKGREGRWYKDLNSKFILEGEWGKDPTREFYTLSMSYGPCPDDFTIFNHDHVHEPPKDYVCGDLTTEIHPMLRRYRGQQLLREYHVRTDFMTDWESEFYLEPLKAFFLHDLSGKAVPVPMKPKRRELIRNEKMRFANVILEE